MLEVKNGVLIRKGEEEGGEHSAARETNKILKLVNRNSNPILLNDQSKAKNDNDKYNIENQVVLSLLKWLEPFKNLQWDPFNKTGQDDVYGPQIEYQDAAGYIHRVDSVRLLPTYIKDARPTITFAPLHVDEMVGLHAVVLNKSKAENRKWVYPKSCILDRYGRKAFKTGIWTHEYYHDDDYVSVFKEMIENGDLSEDNTMPFNRLHRAIESFQDSFGEEWRTSWNTSSGEFIHLVFHTKSLSRMMEATIIFLDRVKEYVNVDYNKLSEQEQNEHYQKSWRNYELARMMEERYSLWSASEMADRMAEYED